MCPCTPKAFGIILLCSGIFAADAVPRDIPPAAPEVKFLEGSLHGFVVLRDESGDPIASGDLTQKSDGRQVTSHLLLHFRDGSSQEETAVFTQRKTFRLLSDHLIQKGPAFKRPMDLLVDRQTSQVTVRTTGDDGKEQLTRDRIQLPPDLANGFISVLLKNAAPESLEGELTLSMIVATPKPRLVKLVVSRVGEDLFTIGGASRKAAHYVAKIQISGVAGVVAPIVGKQPPDIHVWLALSDVPQFVRSKGPLFDGGPIWTLDFAAPSWP